MMNLIASMERRIQKMTFWDITLTKTVTILFGVIVGAYISEFVKHYIWPLSIVFIVGYIIAIYRFWKK